MNAFIRTTKHQLLAVAETDFTAIDPAGLEALEEAVADALEVTIAARERPFGNRKEAREKLFEEASDSLEDAFEAEQDAREEAFEQEMEALEEEAEAGGDEDAIEATRNLCVRPSKRRRRRGKRLLNVPLSQRSRSSMRYRMRMRMLLRTTQITTLAAAAGISSKAAMYATSLTGQQAMTFLTASRVQISSKVGRAGINFTAARASTGSRAA
nr:hypothetical protein [Paracoccus saliphilus]